MNRHIYTQRIDWNGITVEVRWEPDWLSGCTVGHLQVTSIAPERAALPVSETGYRSAFLDPALVIAEGGPLTFVREWLDAEACAPEWKARQEAARQLALF